MATNEVGDEENRFVFENDFATGNQESRGDTASRGTSRDPNSVLYLHHSDHPNYVLSTQLLNDRNYYHWKRSVEVSLRAKNKLDFVNGKCVKPGIDSPDLSQWERCNSMVMSWLLHSVEKDITETVLYCDSSVEVWNDLKMRFGFPNCTRLFQVQKELFNVCQGNLSITGYYTKFKRLWDEYIMLVEMPNCTSCGAAGMIPQFLYNLQVIQFLVGLNDSYNLVRANVLMMKPMPLIGEVYHMVLQDEKQKELRSSAGIGSDSSALNAHRGAFGRGNYNNSGSSGREGYNGQSRGGGRGSSTAGNSDRKMMYYCDHCKVHGHSVERCYKIHGYPHQRNDKEKQQRGSAYSAAGDVETHQGNSSSNGSIDSGEKNFLFTQEQVNQLLALLSKNEATNQWSNAGNPKGNKSTMMSGPFNEQLDGSW